MMLIYFLIAYLGFVSCTDQGQLADPVGRGDTITFTANPIKTDYISDLVLLYHGGTHRLDYTEEELAPYVYKLEHGKRDWLFDGFLFIEFKDNRGTMYADGYGAKPAGKNEWMWLLDRNFEKGKGVSALNSLLGKLYYRKDYPKRSRKVILTLPEPIRDFENWGFADAKKLDFKSEADRIMACKWYIDYALNLWAKQGFDHVELAGFYWVAETQKNADSILPEIGKYIRSKGLKFYWIPYMNAQGAEKWKEAGFDVAYQQPNYFFHLDRPKTLFEKAVYNSKSYSMGLEMEFDDRITDSAFRSRYYDYLEAFQEAEAWEKTPIAYYEGGGTWLRMYRSSDSQVKRAFTDLQEIIIKRQKREDSNH